MISVIVPNYNHLQFLPKRLETIFSQTFQDFEVILLDDCSTDGSWEYLKQFEHHPKVSHCIRNEFNSGSPFKQWKKGLDLAEYDWIWIAESDDFCEKNFLEKLIIKRDSSTSLVFSFSKIIDENNFVSRSYLNWDETDELGFTILSNDFQYDGRIFLNQFQIFRNVIPNASAVIFKKPNNIPLEFLKFKYSGDWYFWLNQLQHGKIIFTNDTTNFSRYHHYSTTSIKKRQEEFLRLREGIKCIDFGRSLLGLEQLRFPLDKGYLYLAKFIFKRNLKLGRLNFKFAFPDIPKYLLPYYYFYFFRYLFR